MPLIHTSSSLPPQTSSSSFGSSSTPSSSILAFSRSSRALSNKRRRFSRRKSSASSGVKKNVSSVSEGRSDQPVGELGACTGIDVVSGRVSRRRRASYLYSEVLVKDQKL